MIDDQPDQHFQGLPVEEPHASRDGFRREQPADQRGQQPADPNDDAAWTASLKVLDEAAWSAGSESSGYSYPQIFSQAEPPSPMTGIGPFDDSPYSPTLTTPQGTSLTPAPVPTRAAARAAMQAEEARAEEQSQAGEQSRASGQARSFEQPRSTDQSRPTDQSWTPAPAQPDDPWAAPGDRPSPRASTRSSTDSPTRASTDSSHRSSTEAPTRSSNRASTDSPTRASRRPSFFPDDPPTSPTTVLPLRRELRELQDEPAPRRPRASTALGVVRGTLGRRETRSHRSGADPRTLGTRFSPRNNHLGLMRLMLALVVGVTHATEIGYGWQPEFSNTQLGELCVDAFFVLSGFLLVGSYLRLDSVRRYTWHRFLRIMPGFWVCLVVSATLIAPLIAYLQGVPMRSLLTGEDSAVDYVIRNATLMMRQWGISGLPTDVEMAGVLNGSLWTLFYEAVCYGSIIALGVFGGLRRRPVMTLGAVGGIWVVTVLNDYEILYVGQERILRLSFMFLIGSVLYLYAHQVPVNRFLTVASVGVIIAGITFFDDYRVLAGPAFGYLLMAVAVSRVHIWEPRTDISYGLYVYHWPILQVLNLLGVAAFSIWVFAPVGLALASVVALMSWKLVEKPALGFKDAGWVTFKLPTARAAASGVRA